MVFTQVLCQVPYFFNFFSPFQKIFLLWGFLLVAIELFRGFKPWKSRSVLIFAAFLAMYAVSIFLADSAYLTGNIKEYVYMVMMFFTLYALQTDDRSLRIREYRTLAIVMIIGVAVVAAAGYYLILWGRPSRRYKTEIGVEGQLGFMNDRFSGVVNPNVGGALYSISIILSTALMSVKRKHRAARNIPYAVNILAVAFLLVLGYSRTSVYALAAVLFIGLLWRLPHMIKPLAKAKKGAVLAARWAVALAVVAAIVIGFKPLQEEVYTPVYTLYKTIKAANKETTAAKTTKAASTTKASETKSASTTEAAETAKAKEMTKAAAEISGEDLIETETTQTQSGSKTSDAGTSEKSTSKKTAEASSTTAAKKKTTKAAVNRNNLTAEKDGLIGMINEALSSRVDIWAAGLELYSASMLFGISHDAITDGLAGKTNFVAWHLHSSYLTVLVAAGAVGALIVAAFSVYGFSRVLKKRRQILGTGRTELVVIVLLIIYMLIREMTEATLLFRLNIFSCFFWMLLGSLRQEVRAMDAADCAGEEVAAGGRAAEPAAKKQV